jgi:hypothetical protein
MVTGIEMQRFDKYVADDVSTAEGAFPQDKINTWTRPGGSMVVSVEVVAIDVNRIPNFKAPIEQSLKSTPAGRIIRETAERDIEVADDKSWWAVTRWQLFNMG